MVTTPLERSTTLNSFFYKAQKTIHNDHQIKIRSHAVYKKFIDILFDRDWIVFIAYHLFIKLFNFDVQILLI